MQWGLGFLIRYQLLLAQCFSVSQIRVHNTAVKWNSWWHTSPAQAANEKKHVRVRWGKEDEHALYSKMVCDCSHIFRQSVLRVCVKNLCSRSCLGLCWNWRVWKAKLGKGVLLSASKLSVNALACSPGRVCWPQCHPAFFKAFQHEALGIPSSYWCTPAGSGVPNCICGCPFQALCSNCVAILWGAVQVREGGGQDWGEQLCGGVCCFQSKSAFFFLSLWCKAPACFSDKQLLPGKNSGKLLCFKQQDDTVKGHITVLGKQSLLFITLLWEAEVPKWNYLVFCFDHLLTVVCHEFSSYFMSHLCAKPAVVKQ